MNNFPVTPPTIILAVEPFNLHANAIADQLRQNGWNPIITPTPQQYAGQAQACVVFLANDMVDNPTVLGAQQAGFASLIPVLLQPMALPPGLWGAQPILAGMDDAATGREIADTLKRVQGAPAGSPSPLAAVPASGPPRFAASGMPSNPPGYPSGMPDSGAPLYAPTSPGPAYATPGQSYPPLGGYPPTAGPPSDAPAFPLPGAASRFPGAAYQPAVGLPPKLPGAGGPQPSWLRIAIIGAAAVAVVIIIVLVLLLRGGGSAATSTAQHSLTGTWSETFSSNNVSYKTTIDLTQNGSTITGQIPIQPVTGLTITVPLTGTLAGQQLTLNGQAQISVAGFPESATVQQTGTVNTDFTSMNGSITVTLVIAVQLDPTQQPTTNTTTLTGPWTATRISH
jgi:hypothetical protein